MLYVSGFFFVLFLVIVAAGESFLPLYGGDRDLAASGSVLSLALTAGWAMAFAQPALWTWFERKTRMLIEYGGSEHRFARFITSGGLKSFYRFLGWAGFAICLMWPMAVVWVVWKAQF